MSFASFAVGQGRKTNRKTKREKGGTDSAVRLYKTSDLELSFFKQEDQLNDSVNPHLSSPEFSFS